MHHCGMNLVFDMILDNTIWTSAGLKKLGKNLWTVKGNTFGNAVIDMHKARNMQSDIV